MTDFEKTYQKALRLLSVKGRFRAELEMRLRQEDFPEEAISKVIERCAAAGYLNDEERGRQKLSSRLRKGYGSRRIMMELRQFMSDEDMKDVLVGFDEKEALRAYLQKHSKLLNDPKAKLRLLRRGFDSNNIDEALKDLRSYRE